MKIIDFKSFYLDKELKRIFQKNIQFGICLLIYRLNSDKPSLNLFNNIFERKNITHAKKFIKKLEEEGILNINSIKKLYFDVNLEKLEKYIIDLDLFKDKYLYNWLDLSIINKLYSMTFYQFVFTYCSLYTDTLQFENGKCDYLTNIVMKVKGGLLLKGYSLKEKKDTFYIDVDKCHSLLFDKTEMIVDDKSDVRTYLSIGL